MSGTELFATFLGSVALLLWGVRMVRTGMTRAFGAALAARRSRPAARTRIGAFFAGIGVTGILQSSTATALLLASFAGRGLIALPLALAVMLGADVGSAVAAQVFSLRHQVAVDRAGRARRARVHVDARPTRRAASRASSSASA